MEAFQFYVQYVCVIPIHILSKFSSFPLTLLLPVLPLFLSLQGSREQARLPVPRFVVHSTQVVILAYLISEVYMAKCVWCGVYGDWP